MAGEQAELGMSSRAVGGRWDEIDVVSVGVERAINKLLAMGKICRGGGDRVILMLLRRDRAEEVQMYRCTATKSIFCCWDFCKRGCVVLR